jgi:hypothetical protein
MTNNSLHTEKFLLRITERPAPNQDAEFTDDVKVGDEFLAYLASVANIKNNQRYLVAIKKSQKRGNQQRDGAKTVLYDGDEALVAEEVLKKVRRELREHGYWNSESFTVAFPEGVLVDGVGVLDALFPVRD